MVLIRSASVIERRAPLTGIYMVDGRQHDLAAISDATAFLREAYVPILEAAVVKEGEEEFTAEERDAILVMGAVARLEIAPEFLGQDELYDYFLGVKIAFSRLPQGSRVRVEMMKNVNDQLGTDAEKLRKSGKKDEEIFEEWLKQVFIPLYRRARKQ